MAWLALLADFWKKIIDCRTLLRKSVPNCYNFCFCSWCSSFLKYCSYVLKLFDNTFLDLKILGGGGISILGDPGAVSWVGRKGRTNVFKYGRKSPWVPTLTELFPKIQVDAGSWLGTKNALYYCAQSANSFSWVLFVSSYTTAIVSPHLPGLFTKLVRARKTFIFTFLTRNEGTTDESKKTFGMLSAYLPREYSVFDGSECIVNF